MYRTIVTDFWNDIVVEELSAHGKLLMLYLLTAPVGNIAGCFQVSMKRITRDTGMTASEAGKAMAELLDSQRVCYSDATNEVLIVNWPRYNWNKSAKLLKSVDATIASVKDESFRQHLERVRNACSEGYEYPIDTISNGYGRDSVSVTDTVSDTVTVENQPKNSSQVATGKHAHGEFSNVLLTASELEKLKERFPSDWESRIDDLSFYIGSTGKSYKSHYRTLLNWDRRDRKPPRPAKGVVLDERYAKYR